MAGTYRRGDYPRACSICGHEFWFSELKYIGQGRYACPYDQGMTAEQISAYNARVKPLIVKPRRHPLPLQHVPTYQMAEAQVLQLVMAHGMSRNLISARGSGASATTDGALRGSCGMYLAELLDEDRRPYSWMAQARDGLRTFADGVLALQYGSPAGPSPSEAATSILFGGILGSASTLTAPATILGGLCLVRAHRILGDASYLDGARRCATWLRNMQRKDLSAISPDAFYVGGVPQQVTTSKVISTSYNVREASMLWFARELRDVIGAGSVFGSSGGDMASDASATLEQMATEARDFYAGNKLNGWSVFAAGATGTGTFGPMSMLSTETPRGSYQPASAQAFRLSTLTPAAPNPAQYYIFMDDWCIGLRGLFEHEGYSDTVAELHEWVRTIATNAAAVPAAGTSSLTLAAQTTGTFDADLCPPLFVTIEEGSSFTRVDKNHYAYSATSPSNDYSIEAASFLAPLRIASGRHFGDLKAAMTRPMRVAMTPASPTSGDSVYAHLRGAAGLSWQATGLMTAAGENWAVVTNAAQAGSLFRYDPKSFNPRGIPQ